MKRDRIVMYLILASATFFAFLVTRKERTGQDQEKYVALSKKNMEEAKTYKAWWQK